MRRKNDARRSTRLSLQIPVVVTSLDPACDFYKECKTAFVNAHGCARAQTHVIEVLADKDSRYKIAGERTPEITVKAGEPVLLRITARRGKSWNRDGSIHGFSLLRAKDRSKVSGWDLLPKPGMQEFQPMRRASTWWFAP